MPENELTEQLQEQMLQPKKVVVDDKTVEQHSLKDVIEMDRYLQSKRAMHKKGFGIRFAKMEAGGSAR